MLSSLVKRPVQQQTPVNISHGETFSSKTFKYSCYLMSGMTEMGRSHSSVSSTLTVARWRRTASTATRAQVRHRTLFQSIDKILKRCVSACLKYKLLPYQGRLWWGLLLSRIWKIKPLWNKSTYVKAQQTRYIYDGKGHCPLSITIGFTLKYWANS